MCPQRPVAKSSGDAKVLLIVSTYKPRAAVLAADVVNFLSIRGFQCHTIEYDGLNKESCARAGYMFAVSIGGDGTTLFAARCASPSGIPIIAINLGRFGFIAPIEPRYWQQALSDYLAGGVRPAERALISCTVTRAGKEIASCLALNDVVLSSGRVARLTRAEVCFNDISFGVYEADGIILATPTGSTAYSAACGGPILDPDLDAFVLTPISALCLSNRPVVVPSSGVVRIKVLSMRHKETVLSVDGHELCTLQEEDQLLASRSSCSARLVFCTPHVFYHALCSKLAWSGSIFSRRGRRHDD